MIDEGTICFTPYRPHAPTQQPAHRGYISPVAWWWGPRPRSTRKALWYRRVSTPAGLGLREAACLRPVSPAGGGRRRQARRHASIARPRAQQLSLGLNAAVPRPALPQPSAPEVLQSSRVLLLHAFDTPQTRSRNLEAPPATAEAVGAGSASESGYSCSRDAGWATASPPPAAALCRIRRMLARARRFEGRWLQSTAGQADPGALQFYDRRGSRPAQLARLGERLRARRSGLDGV